VYNNELGFEEQNIRAVCDVGSTTKGKHKFGYIGLWLSINHSSRISPPQFHGFWFMMFSCGMEIMWVVPLRRILASSP